MSDDQHDWLVIHRLRFPKVVDGLEAKFPGPLSADVWRFGPENSELDETGMLTYRSDAWGGISLYSSREAAEVIASDPAQSLPFYGEAVESWTAFAVPVSHRGEVEWRGYVESNTAIRVAEKDPGGPLAIITTAGYNVLGSEEVARLIFFIKHVQGVLDFYEGFDGILRSCVFYAAFDGHDGLTCSLWRNDAAMQRAAYGQGAHREKIESHKVQPMVDRTSFTRARILSSVGTWGGEDPTDQMS